MVNSLQSTKPHFDSPPTNPLPTIPSVTVQSPRSFRSPTRSPRLSQLLLALKDVIGESEEEESEEVFESSTSVNDPGGSEESWTVVEETSDLHPVFEHPLEYSPDASDPTEIEDDDQPTIRASSLAQDNEALVNVVTPHSDEAVPSVLPEKTPEALSNLLSPVDIENLPLVPFLQNKSGDFIDSGYADSWTSPFPLLKSPPRSPSVSSVFDPTFSPFRTPPVAVSSRSYVGVAPHGSPIVSPHSGEACVATNTDTVTLAFSPGDEDAKLENSPAQEWRDFEGEETSKYIGKPQSQDDDSEADSQISLDPSSSDFSDLEHREANTYSPLIEGAAVKESTDDHRDGFGQENDVIEQSISDECIDHSSADGDASAELLMPSLSLDDVETAITRSTSSPLCFLSSSPLTFEAEMEAKTTLSPPTPSHTFKPETALSPQTDSFSASPTLRVEDIANENDTLHSLYDIYSDFDSPTNDPAPSNVQSLSNSSGGVERSQSPDAMSQSQEISSQSPVESNENTSMDSVFGSGLSTAATGSDNCSHSYSINPLFSRSPVFTPPPSAELPNESTKVSTQSSRSRSSLSPRCATPVYISPKAQGKQPAASPDSETQESEVSTKVPFGFRTSSTLVRGLITCVNVC